MRDSLPDLTNAWLQLSLPRGHKPVFRLMGKLVFPKGPGRFGKVFFPSNEIIENCILYLLGLSLSNLKIVWWFPVHITEFLLLPSNPIIISKYFPFFPNFSSFSFAFFLCILFFVFLVELMEWLLWKYALFNPNIHRACSVTLCQLRGICLKLGVRKQMTSILTLCNTMTPSIL